MAYESSGSQGVVDSERGTRIVYRSTKELNEPTFAVTVDGRNFNIGSLINGDTKDARDVTLWVSELCDFLYARGSTDIQANTTFFFHVLQGIRILLQTRYACRMHIEATKVFFGPVPEEERNRPMLIRIPSKIVFYPAGSLEPA